MTTRIKLNIDRTQYRTKEAAKAHMGAIKNKVGAGSTEIDARELMALVESGGSFAPALMNGTGSDNWQSQQVIIADIDNDEPERDEHGELVKDENNKVRKVPVKDQLSSVHAAEVCKEYNITPFFMYHTLSNGKVVDGVSMEKYRVIVVLDQPITDAEEAHEITARFIDIFNKAAPGSADVSVKNLDRVLFGSNKGSVFNNSGSITPLEVMRALPEVNDALSWEDPIEEPTQNQRIRNNGGWYDNYPVSPRSNDFAAIKEQRRRDIDSFDLESFVLRDNPGSRTHKNGNQTYINPCPICSHNDCFAVKGNIFKLFCSGRDAEKGDGGSIIDYFIYKDELTQQEALKKFDALMGYEPPKTATASKPDPAQQAPTEPEQSAEKSYFSKNQQLTMLGNWLNDNHREDIALFGKALFDFKNLYTEIVKGGKTFLQIMAENKNDGVTITAITAAVESAGATLAEATYQEAKAEALLAQREKLIEIMARPGVDIPFVTDHLLRVQAAIDQREVKPAAANLSETLLAAIDQDAQALKLKYGRGFEDLDKKAGSMKAGQLIVLAARPATGKSAAALQIAYNVANKGAKTLFFPLEMTTRETLERLVLQQEIIESKEALAAPTDEEKENLRAFLDDVESKGNLLFYEGVNNLEAITQTIKEQRPAFVVIDQLTQVRTARRAKDIRERYVEITADLKHIAIEYQTTILLLTQLNRDTTKQSRPTLENLHESDATGQNADVVLLMQKRDPDESTPDFARSDIIDIYVVKNRGGQSEFRVTVKFYGNKTKFCRK